MKINHFCKQLEGRGEGGFHALSDQLRKSKQFFCQIWEIFKILFRAKKSEF